MNGSRSVYRYLKESAQSVLMETGWFPDGFCQRMRGNYGREMVKRRRPMWLSVMRYGRCDFIFRTQGPRTIGFIGF